MLFVSQHDFPGPHTSEITAPGSRETPQVTSEAKSTRRSRRAYLASPLLRSNTVITFIKCINVIEKLTNPY